MIAIRLQGRLGNQLFQYAFIYSASKKTGANFYLDQYFERSLVKKYFQINTSSVDIANQAIFNLLGYKSKISYPLQKYLNNTFNWLFKLQVKEYDFFSEDNAVEFSDHTLYLGFFQSLTFLKPYEYEIRNKLRLKQQIVKSFKNRFGSIYQEKKVVTVHIRRTDYKSLAHLNLGSDDISLPINYYKNAIASLKSKELHFIFISDDTQFVEENFADISPKTISRATEIIDFQHLLNADACIISNSTFSWWGAWLNTKKNKQIYCPQYYLGFHLKKQIPQNIYPKEWRQVEFN